MAKLLLIEDVEDLGRKGDIVSVRPGFARNFLLPRRLALVANAKVLLLQEKLQQESLALRAADRDQAEKQAAVLNALSITIPVKVDHEGHMYGSVSAHDLVEFIQAQSEMEIEKKAIQLVHPIKATGNYSVGIKLKEGVQASIKVVVLPEGSEQPKEAENS